MSMTQSTLTRDQNTNLRRGSWQKGCLIAFVVVMVLAIGLAVTAALTWRRIMASGMNSAANAMVTQSALPQDQKDRILAKVSGVTSDFKDGKVSMQQVGMVMQAVVESPLIPLAVMAGVEAKYFAKSGLNADEKAGAKVAIQRFARGVADEKLTMDDMGSVMAPISSRTSVVTTSTSGGAARAGVTTQNGNFQLKPTVTDEELRKFISDVKEKADKAQIAENVPEMNIAEEIEKAIDAGLAKGK
jgi:hypothetical protein